MKISELKEFDAAEVLTDDETIRHYLALAFEEGDPKAIQTALGTVARARGMSELAREAGVKREALYRALSEKGNPEFATIVKVLGALGWRLTVAEPTAPGHRVAVKASALQDGLAIERHMKTSAAAVAAALAAANTKAVARAAKKVPSKAAAR